MIVLGYILASHSIYYELRHFIKATDPSSSSLIQNPAMGTIRHHSIRTLLGFFCSSNKSWLSADTSGSGQSYRQLCKLCA